jgi:hypothetical protein
MSYQVLFTDRNGDRKIQLYFGKEIIYTAEVQQLRVITEQRSGYDSTFKFLHLIVADEVDMMQDEWTTPTTGRTIYKSLNEFVEVSLQKHRHTLQKRNLVVLDPIVGYTIEGAFGELRSSTREEVERRLEQLEVLKATVNTRA